MHAVGIIANPHAGKDLRRLTSAADATSDHAKLGIIRRVLAGLAETGVDRILLGGGARGLPARAAATFDVDSEILESPGTGSRLESVADAVSLRKAGVGAVVVLGGDGTCRDVTSGWPDLPLVAISTGTNNVFPVVVEATAAGLAAGLVATGGVALEAVSSPAQRVCVAGAGLDEEALVEVALVDGEFVGTGIVDRAEDIRVVVAAIAEPAATGLSGIAGRAQPVGRHDPGGVVVELASEGRMLRVPLGPGVFSTVHVDAVHTIDDHEPVTLRGPGVLALDGERRIVLPTDEAVTVHIERSGPRVIDVARTLRLAVGGDGGR